jgi:hypothetical protein
VHPEENGAEGLHYGRIETWSQLPDKLIAD